MTDVTVRLGERSYKVHIGRDLVGQVAGLLPFEVRSRRLFIIVDENAQGWAERLCDGLRASGARDIYMLLVAGGETAKSFSRLESLLGWLLHNKIDRQSVLFAVGGGVIGDLTGFAAAIIQRGVPFVQVPTTLLAQIDSSVGGKTAVNMPQGKNMVGAFHQPAVVICDTETLSTLPAREMRAGYAEGVKHGALGDAALFNWLEEHSRAVLAQEPAALAEFVSRNCAFKAAVVAADETETTGRRALLNLGHTFGHALEAAAGYDGRLLHGEAVAIGMALAGTLSVRLGLCPPAEAKRVRAHLTAVGLPTLISQITPRLAADEAALMDYMKGDKKAAGGKTILILSRGVGQAFICYDAPEADIRAVIAESIKGE